MGVVVVVAVAVNVTVAVAVAVAVPAAVAVAVTVDVTVTVAAAVRATVAVYRTGGKSLSRPRGRHRPPWTAAAGAGPVQRADRAVPAGQRDRRGSCDDER